MASTSAFPWLNICLRSVSGLDFSSGDSQIDQGIYVKAVEYPSAKPSPCEFETHRDHVDVQVCLEGSEIILLSRRSQLSASRELDERADVIFYRDSDRVTDSIIMEPGSVLVLFPDDAHRCAEQVGEKSEMIRKFVFKVPREVWEASTSIDAGG